MAAPAWKAAEGAAAAAPETPEVSTKTTCKHWLNGTCRWGPECTYAHASDGATVRPRRRIDGKWCNKMFSGCCTFGSKGSACEYWHLGDWVRSHREEEGVTMPALLRKDAVQMRRSLLQAFLKSEPPVQEQVRSVLAKHEYPRQPHTGHHYLFKCDEDHAFNDIAMGMHAGTCVNTKYVGVVAELESALGPFFERPEAVRRKKPSATAQPSPPVQPSAAAQPSPPAQPSAAAQPSPPVLPSPMPTPVFRRLNKLQRRTAAIAGAAEADSSVCRGSSGASDCCTASPSVTAVRVGPGALTCGYDTHSLVSTDSPMLWRSPVQMPELCSPPSTPFLPSPAVLCPSMMCSVPTEDLPPAAEPVYEVYEQPVYRHEPYQRTSVGAEGWTATSNNSSAAVCSAFSQQITSPALVGESPVSCRAAASQGCAAAEAAGGIDDGVESDDGEWLAIYG
eukprot:TRINITY_DN1127_c0_g1_i1.p1 TRINITY_DN1127_c0_g1~~TRINITY_DN1127_c0_g1_i1.p1  ORF type:complete len:449 (+),score=193.02 TRINITY_DN1127_c0_g1_i1:62-1408(+)